MFTRKKQTEISIPVPLDEPLTTDSCTKLIMELLKYILYQKQQIPFAYDTLTQLQTRYKPTDKNGGSMKTAMSSLRMISENLTSQLHLGGCDVREIILMIGATTMSPKLCIKLELPNKILNSHCHGEYQHSSRKPLLNLMRSIIDCEEFQDAMTVPLGLTNTFVLLQKSDSNATSDFFLPKPQYTPPSQMAPCFSIKFTNSPDIDMTCNCTNAIKVYDDLLHNTTEEAENCEHYTNSTLKSSTDRPYLWYQSREVIKGFKFSR